jgi:hypothetical protein
VERAFLPAALDFSFLTDRSVGSIMLINGLIPCQARSFDGNHRKQRPWTVAVQLEN